MEPQARLRDAAVIAAARSAGLECRTLSDQTLLPLESLRNAEGAPYSIFTPFSKAARASLESWPLHAYRSSTLLGKLMRRSELPAGMEIPEAPRPAQIGAHVLSASGESAARERLRAFCAGGLAGYPDRRDLPGEDATSRLSLALAHGCISARTCWIAAQKAVARDAEAAEGARAWTNVLLWRCSAARR